MSPKTNYIGGGGGRLLNLTLPNNCNLIPLGHGTWHERAEINPTKLEITRLEINSEDKDMPLCGDWIRNPGLPDGRPRC